MVPFFFSLGSNLGDREKHLNGAIHFLKHSGDTLTLTKISPWYKTSPWQAPGHPKYLNFCVGGETKLDPLALLKICQDIEERFGRKKREGPRTLDIDLLLYDELSFESPNLILPHPRMHLRRFVLKPLADIVPDFLHPVQKKTISELLKELKDDSMVTLWPSAHHDIT